MPTRIAMWSGPRNISTAMMRAWENREDTVVVDEPLYAYYLAATDADHPVREEVIAAGETDWREVARQLTGPVPHERPIYYQKHMTHHLLPEVQREWMGRLLNCFLIRDPREILLSYSKKRSDVTVEDVGIVQQAEIFDHVRRRTGATPPVIDARDVLENPRAVLGALCETIGVPFSDRMLSWPSGRRDTDGVWADHWYDSVIASTGFQPYRRRTEALPPALEPILEISRPHYERIRAFRLR